LDARLKLAVKPSKKPELVKKNWKKVPINQKKPKKIPPVETRYLIREEKEKM